jgi:hypothetical protein
MQEIKIATDFYHRLANRDSRQGDGRHTAVEFREKYLSSLDSKAAWGDAGCIVLLDFEGVRKIGPSFANEAFAYFTKYADPETILKKICLKNASNVQSKIIQMELETGYKRRT